MEVIIEPTDVFGIIYAILQVRQCVPLQNEIEYQNGRKSRERLARMVRTIGVRRVLGFMQLTKAEAGVFMAVAFEISLKALVLG